MHNRRRSRWVYVFGMIALLAAFPLSMAPPVAANHTIDVTVRITKVTHLGGGLEEDLNEGPADLYAGVTIDGQLFDSFGIHVDDADSITPRNWVWTKSVPVGRGFVPVDIQIWDHDDCDEAFCDNTGIGESDDDQGDADPGGDDIVNLKVDPTQGTWSGDATSPTTCLNGGFATDSVEVCWAISTSAPDADGDGLLDTWEQNGLDVNDDGTVDVNLPAMGADWQRADIFLELDFSAGQAPARDDVRAMQRAFAASPRLNPNGSRGISLWVDTGGLVDPTAIEGQPERTCMDGLDNGGDGQFDGNDPDCFNQPGTRQYLETSIEDPTPAGGNCNDGIDNNGDGKSDGNDLTCVVGDLLNGNLGGNQLAAPLLNCGLDTTFYLTKTGIFAGLQIQAPNFNPARTMVFHYMISTANDIDTDGAGPDTDTCGIGGQGEIGGNDFIEYNHDGGTLMHELGHNLGLRHGGDDNDNCEPNYVSGMNYDHQFGIPRVGGGAIIDYSPPRINVDGSTRGTVPPGVLDETNLNESLVLDGSDGANRFLFTRATAAGVVQKIATTRNVSPDWNGDGDTSDPAPGGPNLQSNINLPGVAPGAPAGTRPAPPACARASITVSGVTAIIPNPNTQQLDSHDDWTNLDLAFQKWGDSTAGPINADEDNLPTLQDRDVLLAAINAADVSVTIADSVDPVGAGEQFTYTLTAQNGGPNPASSVEVQTTLPADVTFVSASVPCVRSANVVTCNLGELLVNASRSFTISVDVPADLVYQNGGPKTLTASATVDNLAGPDANSGNDSDMEETLVITKADVKISNVTTTSPLEILIGQQAGVTIDVTVENGGPSTPVDTNLTGTVTASAGVTVTPATSTAGQTALATGTPEVVSLNYTLDCTTPGIKTVSFSYALALSLAKDPNAIDPDTSNNAATASFSVDCVVPIAINVRPKGFPNSINLNTDATLAALTTNAGEYGLPLAFDATTIDPVSVRWGLRTNLFNISTPTGAREIHNQGHLERSYELDEKTRDADLDMVLHFKPAESGLTRTATEACLRGSFVASDGNVYRFLGCDSVRIVPKQ